VPGDFEERLTALEDRMDMESGLRASIDRDLSALAMSQRSAHNLLQALALTQSDQTRLLEQHTRMFEELSSNVNQRFEGVNSRLDVVDGRFDRMDGRFDAMDGRLDRMDGRFDRIDGRFDEIVGLLKARES
jgi:hypothetical protein